MAHSLVTAVGMGAGGSGVAIDDAEGPVPDTEAESDLADLSLVAGGTGNIGKLSDG
jgi:hypothetical protein